MSETLVKAENVSKKFCRDLKRSLWYGVQDVGAELLGRSGSQNGLPPLRTDEFWAVQDVNFDLKRGDCLGLIGRNGAGKSTLLKMLNGLLKPDTGRIEMRGRVGALIELGTGFNPILTGRENVYVNGSVLGFSRKEIDRKLDAILEFAEIGDFIDMPVKNYSSGMKVRLGFAVAAQMDPEILLIDEVLAVGDAGFRSKCLKRVADFIRDGKVIILVSHSMVNIARSCNKAVVLEKGQIRFQGDTSDAIDIYNSLTPVENRVFELTTDSVSLKSAKLNNAEWEDTIRVNKQEELCIEFNLGARAASAEKLVLVINIRDLAGNTVGSIRSDVQGVFIQGDSNEDQIIRLNIPKHPLNSGVYDFQVSVVPHDARNYLLRIEGKYLVQVVGGLDTSGFVAFEHDWTLES